MYSVCMVISECISRASIIKFTLKMKIQDVKLQNLKLIRSVKVESNFLNGDELKVVSVEVMIKTKLKQIYKQIQLKSMLKLNA
jgi:hypothetical protein